MLAVARHAQRRPGRRASRRAPRTACAGSTSTTRPRRSRTRRASRPRRRTTTPSSYVGQPGSGAGRGLVLAPGGRVYDRGVVYFCSTQGGGPAEPGHSDTVARAGATASGRCGRTTRARASCGSSTSRPAPTRSTSPTTSRRSNARHARALRGQRQRQLPARPDPARASCSTSPSTGWSSSTGTPRFNDEFAGSTFSPDGHTLFVNIQASRGHDVRHLGAVGAHRRALVGRMSAHIFLRLSAVLARDPQKSASTGVGSPPWTRSSTRTPRAPARRRRCSPGATTSSPRGTSSSAGPRPATRSSRSCCRGCAASARRCCCWPSASRPSEAGWPVELFEARPGRRPAGPGRRGAAADGPQRQQAVGATRSGPSGSAASPPASPAPSRPGCRAAGSGSSSSPSPASPTRVTSRPT